MSEGEQANDNHNYRRSPHNPKRERGRASERLHARSRRPWRLNWELDGSLAGQVEMGRATWRLPRLLRAGLKTRNQPTKRPPAKRRSMAQEQRRSGGGSHQNLVAICGGFPRGLRLRLLPCQSPQERRALVHRFARVQDGGCGDHGNVGYETADAGFATPLADAHGVEAGSDPAHWSGAGRADCSGSHAGRCFCEQLTANANQPSL